MVRKKKEGMLTEVELEFMIPLWELGEASVRELLAQIHASRKLAYTSAASIMRILESKGMVTSVKDGKTYIYKPILQKTEYESRSIDLIVNTLFANEPTSLVARLIDQHDLSEKELLEIRKMIENKVKPS